MVDKALFNENRRMTGYAAEIYSASDSEIVAETTEDDLAMIFETAKGDGETLDGVDESIDAAVDDPLAFRDYLILDSNDEIVLDTDYVRETPDNPS